MRVPVENLVGEENRGWDYAKFLLGNERTGIARVGLSKRASRASSELAGARARPATAADRGRRASASSVAALEIELKALEITQMRVRRRGEPARRGKPDPASLDPQDQGLRDPAGDDRAAAGGRRPLRAALPAADGTSGSNEPPVGPDWAAAAAPTYFNYRKISIYGGSNEIQRNIIAKAILGL